jgi:uncharacterized protein YjbJ (UPF0337 family)
VGVRKGTALIRLSSGRRLTAAAQPVPASHPIPRAATGARLKCGRIGNVGGATDDDTLEEIHMGTGDKIENKAEDLKGQAKEAAGEATDDEELEAEGKTDQMKSNLKDAKENVKDAFS